MVVLGGLLVKTYFRRKSADENKKKHEQFPSMQIDSTGHLQKNVSLSQSEIFSYEKNA